MTEKRAALVTGTSTGFGRAIVEALARKGYAAFAGMRDPDGKNRAARDEIAALPDLGITTVALDVTDDASVSAAVDAVTRKAGRIDVLVNNAGVGWAGLTECGSVEQVRKVYETNVFGPQRLCRAVVPMMREQRSGVLVFVSSMGGRMLMPNASHYCASKAALEMMAEGYRVDLASFGVDVVILEPGIYKTRMFHNMWMADDEARAAHYGALAGHARAGVDGAIAMGGGAPEEVADTVVKLVEMPHGQRPLRTTMGADAALVAPVNAAADEAGRIMRAMWGG